MINHFRTLLANLDGSAAANDDYAEVYIPPGKWEAGPGAPESSAGLGQSRRFQARETVP